MKIQFHSFQDFMTMDGHGVYVWLAVLVSLWVLVGLVLRPLSQHREISASIQRQLAGREIGYTTSVQPGESDAPNS
jgi:heme exporter protein D